MEDRYSEVLTAIRSTGKLEESTEEGIKNALTDLLSQYGKAV